MDASPFGKLSGELRNRIYHYFFEAQLAEKFHFDIRNDRARLRTKKKEIRSALALTATSRLLRRETLSIFWSKISFRIIANTLTAYSYPGNSLPMDVKPRDRGYEINKFRAATLVHWLKRSGILRFAHYLRPIELDLGVWDPRLYTRERRPVVLGLIRGSVAALTTPLRYITSCSLNDDAAECTLVFRLSLQPSTAMGPICVPNDRKQALVVVKELCEERQSSTLAKFLGGFFTRHGYSAISSDIASCRAVADLLVGYIVEKKEEKSEGSDGSDSPKTSKSPGGKKGKRGGN
jgi:hypothetical protein